MNVCNDNCLFWNQIELDREEIIVFILMRIGMGRPQEEYLRAVIRMAQTRWFTGILGGKPKNAYFFTEVSEDGT